VSRFVTGRRHGRVIGRESVGEPYGQSRPSDCLTLPYLAVYANIYT